ncbi:MAG: GNAT family N-acetyltransferase [Dysgonamonadaceae bacterium]|jgi:ribosomal protein S18 acetylase RimI-like enzyme|nr:GNAT family N-acetyltransferase [Dysgonamonadaceae bacterium]
MDKIQDYNQIRNAIAAVKAHRKGLLTNFFIGESRCNLLITKGLLHIVDFNQCVFILHEDHHFYHIYYISTDIDALSESFEKIFSQYQSFIWVIDIIGIDNHLLSSLCEQHGFEKYVSLTRMSRIKNISLSQESDSRVKYATIAEEEQIVELLENHFDKYSEQIPVREEITEWIKGNRIITITEQSRVIGFIIFEINGVTSFLRYWFTHPEYRDRKIGSALLRRFFHECRYTKRQLFWVIDTNNNAIARYKHYGFEFEQMYDQVMIKKI